ncbi:MAG TPA: glycosyltransferase family 2 protein [Gammaproteobacteria bacterium]|jgi:glycosyltransferase involved in cell wall biosynthesis|nr:glycosyltransferase family 2 protein [Gammaproteobacteria bacterium]
MELFFYCTAALCCYSYFLYPLVLKLLPRRTHAVATRDGELPRLSLIVTVHNEAGRIRAKIENTLAIDYPPDRLEIMVASDGSTDATEDIVGEFAARGVRLVRADQRNGKEYAQLCAIRIASGDILVFSDVATRIPADALRMLAGEFADERVGAVSSEDRFISQDGSVAGEGAYVKYEMWLRRLESDRAGLVGLSGSFFAARREVCEEWDTMSPSDFNTALNCARMGLVAVSCPAVVGIYADVKDPSLEYQRKVRTVVRGMTALARHPIALDPLRMGMFAFQVWSHKVMRWGVPWFMLALLIVTLLLMEQGLVYRVALSLQAGFYLLALVGWLSARLRKNAVVRIVFFFVQTNIALAQAAVLFLSGTRMTTWNPSRR